MAKVNPEEFAEKHARRLTESLPDIRRGIERVTESPTKKAAQQQEKMLRKLTQAVTSGKWKAGLDRVTVEDWKNKTLNVGVDRIPAGIAAANGKMVRFAEQLLPHVDRVKAEVDKLPSITLEDSINRMTTFVRGMAKFKRTQ